MALAAAAVAVSLMLPAPASAITLPPGFEDLPLATAPSPISIAWAPDGRLFAASQANGGKVHVFNPGATTPSKTLILRTGNIFGIALDKDFASNGYLYAVRTHGDNTTQRLVRAVVNADSTLVNPASPETVLLGSVNGTCPPPSNTVDCIKATSDHDFGTVRSDPRDGTLWLGAGDGSPSSAPGTFEAQNEQSYYGKILHVDRNGKGLPGHPFCPSNNNLSHVCTKVAAMGFRNPFRFTLRPGGNPIVGDVGWRTREELSIVVPGRNYGWPCYEGTTRTPGHRDDPKCAAQYAKEGTAAAAVAPIYDYGHTALGASITGGPTYLGGSYPADYTGNVFFADYVNGTIKRVVLNSSDQVMAVNDFATGAGGIVDLELEPNTGDLVYVRLGGDIRRIRGTGGGNRAPVSRASANPTSGVAPLTVAFQGSGSSDPDGDSLSYDWDFGDGTAHSSAANPSHTYSSNGSYTARLTVRDSKSATNSTTVAISVGNAPPSVSISAPATYRAGQTITLSGSATDPEDGSLAGSALDWKVRMIHVDHEHLVVVPSEVSETSFEAPTDHDADSHVEVTLTATDSKGATAAKTVSIQPETRRLTIDSSPTGAPITHDGRDFTAPLTKQSTIGFKTQISAAQQFQRGGETWEFAGWSDGGARLHEITVPAADSTLVANYRQVGTAATSFEAETMGPISPTGDARSVPNPDASGGREVFIVRRATITRSLVLPASQQITVRARGDQCNGPPNMVVTVDGAQVLSVPVSASTFADYTADVGLPAGLHTIAISFVNDYGQTCDRNLRVDKVTLSSAPPPPPPSAGTSFEAETMWPISPTGSARSVPNPDASGGREVFILRRATVKRSLALPAFQRITVRARGDQCEGAPTMAVNVDGIQVLSAAVSERTFADYSADVGIPEGSHTISVSFVNDYSAGCDRNLRVDKVTVRP